MTAMISMGLRQNLSLSPQLQQAMQMLQMSTLDFEQLLRESASSNPFLEIDEAEADTPEAADQGFAFERVPATAAAFDGDPMERLPEPGGLGAVLRRQLYGSRCTARELAAAEAVIDSLDEDGYLRDDVPAGVAEPPLRDEEIAAAIDLVRSFEPAGVGARNLVDCLLLQLDAEPRPATAHVLARAILREHLPLLEKREFHLIERRLQCAEGDLRRALQLIRHLDPAPAHRYAAPASQYIVPDVMAVRRGRHFVARLNPTLHSGVRLNQGCIDLFRRNCRRGEHPQLSGQLRDARWLLRNACRRGETILRLASHIVDHQQAFFLAGDVGLQPMTARDIAAKLGLHESTVSRAAAHKFIATPRGCFELRHFLTRELAGEQGSCSAGAARSLIRTMIESESPGSPLSDISIARALQSGGMNIARRTVTKYRNMLKLPAVEFRRSSARPGE
ncbi:RNA polymerase sigma-54 factor [Solimonas fluminis]|uniref:RNA polymerase sigma-54 factor n=1 Tax=Solimonas fluminis TaxID=2086571 RepID=A0A2S5TB00_9GAMM|nr:RNA polymerase factor sigma-54 [Solimonas fluminis]PPE72018.1 RNA polymerase sigma-54 factor [Solimonas fluminis]